MFWGMSDVSRAVNNNQRGVGASHLMGAGPNEQERELRSRIPANLKRIFGQGHPVGGRGGSQVMQRGFCPSPACGLQSKETTFAGKRQSSIFYKFVLPIFPQFGISASSVLHDKPLRAHKMPYFFDITFF